MVPKAAKVKAAILSVCVNFMVFSDAPGAWEPRWVLKMEACGGSASAFAAN